MWGRLGFGARVHLSQVMPLIQASVFLSETEESDLRGAFTLKPVGVCVQNPLLTQCTWLPAPLPPALRLPPHAPRLSPFLLLLLEQASVPGVRAAAVIPSSCACMPSPLPHLSLLEVGRGCSGASQQRLAEVFLKALPGPTGAERW